MENKFHTVILGDGKTAIFDDFSFEIFNSGPRWVNQDGYFVARTRKKKLFFHVVVMEKYLGRNIIFPENEIDHIDRNTLNNSVSNLRLVTRGVNQQNKQKKKNTTSKFVGVSAKSNTHRKIWVSRITKNYEVFQIGDFENEILAARYYDAAALDIYGPFARTNVSLGLLEPTDQVYDWRTYSRDYWDNLKLRIAISKHSRGGYRLYLAGHRMKKQIHLGYVKTLDEANKLAEKLNPMKENILKDYTEKQQPKK
jgi:hypothetical protein